MWLIGWPLNRKIQYLRLQSSGFPTGKYRIWSICLETPYTWRRERLSFESRKIWCSTKRALYHHHTLAGKLKEVLWFVVPMAHWVAAMNGCHQDAGHQGQQQTLYLLQDWFWWPSMATQMQKPISNCEQFIQHEGTWAKAPIQPIIATAAL